MIVVLFSSEDNVLSDEIKICYIFSYQSKKKNQVFCFFWDTQYSDIQNQNQQNKTKPRCDPDFSKLNAVITKLIFPLGSTVRPRLSGQQLSGHQLSDYLHYPAAILRSILSILHSFLSKILLKTKMKYLDFCFISFYI